MAAVNSPKDLAALDKKRRGAIALLCRGCARNLKAMCADFAEKNSKDHQ